MADAYRFEDVRAFFVKRPYFRHAGVGDYRLSETEFASLSARTLSLDQQRAAKLRAFIDGYLTAIGKA